MGARPGSVNVWAVFTRTDAFVRSTMRARAVKAWKAAKLEPLTPHVGRHCCAS